MLKIIIATSVLVAGVAGVWLGSQQATTAVMNVIDVSEKFETLPGQWGYSDTIGSTEATALERARIAIGGPLGLAASETIYFLKNDDNEGAALNSSCSYEVSGTDLDARWWSVTVYDGETLDYIKNEDNRSSWNSVALGREEDGTWRFTIAPSRPATGQWLPSQAEPNQPIELLLRLYNPSEETRAKAPNIALPRVENTSC